MKPDLIQRLKPYESRLQVLYALLCLICFAIALSKMFRGEQPNSTWLIVMSTLIGLSLLGVITLGFALKLYKSSFSWALYLIGSSLYTLGFLAGDYKIYFAGSATLLVFGTGLFTFLLTLRAPFSRLKHSYREIRKETEGHQASITER